MLSYSLNFRVEARPEPSNRDLIL